MSALGNSARAAEPASSPFGIQASETGALDERPVDIRPTQRPVDPPPFDASRPPAVKPSEIRVSTEPGRDKTELETAGDDARTSPKPVSPAASDRRSEAGPAGQRSTGAEPAPVSEARGDERSAAPESRPTAVPPVPPAPPGSQAPPQASSAEVARDRPMPPSGEDAAPVATPASSFVDPFAPESGGDQPRSLPSGEREDSASEVIVRDSLGQAVISGGSASASPSNTGVSPAPEGHAPAPAGSESPASQDARPAAGGPRRGPAAEAEAQMP